MPRHKGNKDAHARRPRTKKPAFLRAVVLNGVRLPRYKLDVLRRRGNVRKQIEAALDRIDELRAAFQAEKSSIEQVVNSDE